jgi:hypothetical protein
VADQWQIFSVNPGICAPFKAFLAGVPAKGSKDCHEIFFAPEIALEPLGQCAR